MEVAFQPDVDQERGVLRLFFLTNFPGPTFIPCPTSIWNSRVLPFFLRDNYVKKVIHPTTFIHTKIRLQLLYAINKNVFHQAAFELTITAFQIIFQFHIVISYFSFI